MSLTMVLVIGCLRMDFKKDDKVVIVGDGKTDVYVLFDKEYGSSAYVRFIGRDDVGFVLRCVFRRASELEELLYY